VPKITEQAEPGGVSCTTRNSSAQGAGLALAGPLREA